MYVSCCLHIELIKTCFMQILQCLIDCVICLHVICAHMGLRQNSGMDRLEVIQTYGSVWITCVLVWIGGMDRPVGSGYGSGLYILTRSHICTYSANRTSNQATHQQPGNRLIWDGNPLANTQATTSRGAQEFTTRAQATIPHGHLVVGPNPAAVPIPMNQTDCRRMVENGGNMW